MKTSKISIESFQKIVDERQAKRVGGMVVDLFSANLVVSVYNALSKDNQEKLMNLSIDRIIKVSYKLKK